MTGNWRGSPPCSSGGSDELSIDRVLLCDLTEVLTSGYSERGDSKSVEARLSHILCK